MKRSSWRIQLHIDGLGGRARGPRNSAFGKLDYLLGKAPGQDSRGKGGFFSSFLGFDAKTLEGALKGHLIDNFGSAAIKGNKIEAIGSVTGANGKTARIKTVWQVKDGTVSFITAVPAKK